MNSVPGEPPPRPEERLDPGAGSPRAKLFVCRAQQTLSWLPAAPLEPALPSAPAARPSFSRPKKPQNQQKRTGEEGRKRGRSVPVPPARLPSPTNLFELVGEVEEGDGHADGLQEDGGDEHGPAGLSGAGTGRGQHHGRAGLAPGRRLRFLARKSLFPLGEGRSGPGPGPGLGAAERRGGGVRGEFTRRWSYGPRQAARPLHTPPRLPASAAASGPGGSLPPPVPPSRRPGPLRRAAAAEAAG